MDQAKKHKLSVIVLETLLYEIFKKGNVSPSEKQIFQKVLKVLRLPQEDLAKIQKVAKSRAKANPENGPFDEKLFIQKLKAQLNNELSPNLSRKFLVKIAQIISSDNELISKYIPSLYEGSDTDMVSGNDGLQSLEKKLDVNKLEETEASSIVDDYNPFDIDLIESLKSGIADQSLKYFNNVLSLKTQGEHDKAIELLLDYSIPLGFDIRYYLLSRLYYEIHSVDKAIQYLSKAGKAGLDSKIVKVESYFHTFELLVN